MKGLIKKFSDSFAGNKKPIQRTFVYCKCGNEMVGDTDRQKNLSFIRDVYVNNRNVVHYKCSKCKIDSHFDFDFPAPLKLPLFEGDNLTEEYTKIYYPVKV